MSVISVVIAEDDASIAEIQRRFVERIDGFEVVGIAHSLADTADLVEVLKPQLLFLDIHFPEGSGLDLLRQLRTQQQAIDVILITAAKDVDSLTEALHSGAFDYILKPLIFERLQTTMQRYRQHRETLNQLAEQQRQGIDQSTVDQLLPRQSPASKETNSLPKGIDALTLKKIQQTLNDQQDACTAEQLGSLTGTSRTTARRYLEFLLSRGGCQADIHYGSVGRPERHYRRN